MATTTSEKYVGKYLFAYSNRGGVNAGTMHLIALEVYGSALCGTEHGMEFEEPQADTSICRRCIKIDKAAAARRA